MIDKKRVIGPQKDVLEVMNAIKVYDNLKNFNPTSEKSFLTAHKQLMNSLIVSPGSYRNQGVGIVKGSKVAHVAPPAKNVSFLIKDLFSYLKTDSDLILIKSCVFHYEMEFIHPFLDGNGRMGRLWQTLILMSKYPVFEFLPFETWIRKTQKKYYVALSSSARSGNSSTFIEYMLDVIDKSLAELLNFNNRTLKDIDRINYFIELGNCEFTRKDYMNVFKDISSATASRDLKKGIDWNLFTVTGTQNKAKYKIK